MYCVLGLGEKLLDLYILRGNGIINNASFKDFISPMPTYEKVKIPKSKKVKKYAVGNFIQDTTRYGNSFAILRLFDDLESAEKYAMKMNGGN